MNQQQSSDLNPFLNILLERNFLKNDAELCRALMIYPPVISKIRHRRHGVSADLLIRMHEAFNMPISELRELMEHRS